MDNERIQQIIAFLKQQLEKKGLRVDRVVLFGSYAHGEPHKDSDLDIAVISPDFEKMGLYERACALTDVEINVVHKFRIPLDLVALSPMEYEKQESPIAHFVREDSIEYR
jgi:predicted nucleotidyltransferase